MTIGQFAEQVKAELPYTPNEQQGALIGALARFCAGLREVPQGPSADRAFVINGYAGTGKTSLVSALVRALKKQKINVVLMAPTGRAAKVFSAYSGFAASTIHRRIYRHSIGGETPGLKDNRDSNTLYIVDEASMIGNDSDGLRNDLLTDLLTYVFAGTNNRLIFLGDKAQLPPVGIIESPAMEKDTLRSLGLKVSTANLTDVVRQGARSGILANSINIRRQMHSDPAKIPVPVVKPYSDVNAVTGEEMAEAIDTAYREFGIDDTIIITRSNARAADFNKAIRADVLYLEGELTKGEPLLIVKNNYYWTRQQRRKDIDFIANGDILRIEKILGTEFRYGFRFADLLVTPMDAPDDTEPLHVKIFLETLADGKPVLPSEKVHRLYQAIIHETPEAAGNITLLRENPYWNALQAKYAYCVTCHKAQGGQWSHAFVDIAYINPDTVGQELHRWMYTATTRARKMLTYLVDTPTY